MEATPAAGKEPVRQARQQLSVGRTQTNRLVRLAREGLHGLADLVCVENDHPSLIRRSLDADGNFVQVRTAVDCPAIHTTIAALLLFGEPAVIQQSREPPAFHMQNAYEMPFAVHANERWLQRTHLIDLKGSVAPGIARVSLFAAIRDAELCR